MVYPRLIKWLICWATFGVMGCAHQAPPTVESVPPVKENISEKILPVEPQKTEAELEAESYSLGEHWWTERQNSNEGVKRSQNKDLWLNKLLTARTYVPAPARQASVTAQQLHEQLKNSPGHGQYYWLQKIQGNPSSENVILIVPQYHRATGLPVLWASLGEEVATVQANLQYLIEDLVRVEKLSCLGIEGSSANRVRRSVGLDKAVSWAQRLRNLFQKILYEAALEDSRLVPAAHTILEGLDPYFRRYVRWQDGVGAAVAKLGDEAKGLNRFGLEDDALVREAEALHMKLLELKQKMMISSKTDEGELAIRDMWLTEYPDFRDGFLMPIEESFGELRRALIELRRDGAVDEARMISDFLGQARVLMEQVLSANEVERYHEYYQDLFGKDVGTPAAKKRANRKLKKRVRNLEKKYQRVVMNSRENHAASRVLDVMKTSKSKTCALVMGAGHEEGLVRSFLKQAKDVGIVIARPYNH